MSLEWERDAGRFPSPPISRKRVLDIAPGRLFSFEAERRAPLDIRRLPEQANYLYLHRKLGSRPLPQPRPFRIAWVDLGKSTLFLFRRALSLAHPLWAWNPLRLSTSSSSSKPRHDGANWQDHVNDIPRMSSTRPRAQRNSKLTARRRLRSGDVPRAGFARWNDRASEKPW